MKNFFGPALNVDGPFEKAEQTLQDFASNLYMSSYLTEAIEQHQKLEEEYWAAVALNDLELMNQKKQEMSLFEGAFKLTTALFDLDGDVL
jgi:hypothetical protein